MASNDMNSWDEDPEELLRQRWQQVFTDFEVQPPSSLSQRILGSLPAGHRHQATRRLIGRVLLVLIGLGLASELDNGNQPTPWRTDALPGQPVTHTQLILTGRTGQPTLPVERFTSSRQLMKAGQTAILPAHEPPADSRLASSGVKPSTDHQTTTGRLSADRGWPRPPTGGRLRATPIVSDSFSPGRVRSVGLPAAILLSGRASIARRGSATASVKRLANGPPAEHSLSSFSGAVQQSTEPHPLALAQLRPRSPMAVSVPLAVSLGTLPRQLPTADCTFVNPAQAKAARPLPQLFVEVVPQSSFQWMSASPVADAHLAQVTAPKAFSPATWGYQIRGGARFRSWQANLLAGHLRRWASYTVYQNRYRVEPSPTNPHQLVQDTYVVAENELLPVVGAGLGQYQRLSQGRYTVELGGQFSYLPTRAQTLISVRGSAARRVLIKGSSACLLSLSFEYGINQLHSEPKQLAIRPLVVGVGLQFQPGSNRQGDR